MVDQVLNVHFEVKKDDKTYTLFVPMGSPLGAVYDVLHEMMQEVVKMSKEAADKMKQPETPELVSDN